MDTMLAARLHKIGEPMQLERLPIPKPRPSDVLIQVKACGIVPNLAERAGQVADLVPGAAATEVACHLRSRHGRGRRRHRRTGAALSPRRPALANMAAAGALDLSVFEHKRYPLTEVNAALAGIPDRNGGFTNFVAIP